MPYTYKAAKVRGRAASDRWQDINALNMGLDVLQRDYAYVLLTLTHSAIDHDVYLDLADAASFIPPVYPALTVAQWLVQVGNTSLPTTDEMPTSSEARVKYADAVYAGYKVDRTLQIHHPSLDHPSAFEPDVVLTRSDAPYLEMFKYCLASVNGLLHPTAAGVDGFYILHGGTSGDIAKDNYVGLYNFKELGEIKCVPITKDMLYKAHPQQKYSDTVHLSLPNEDLSGKTVMLSIGGFLHVLDDVYKQVGSNLFRVDMANYQWFHRHAILSKRIDLSTMVLDSYPGSPTTVTLSQLYSDATIEALFTLPQSFFIILDADDVYVDRHYIEKSGLNGKYYSHIVPNMPCYAYGGLLAEYWRVDDWGDYVISIDHNLDPNYNIHTTDWGRQAAVDETCRSIKPFHWTKPYFLEVGRIK